jgi:hypothetical protein
VNGTQRSNRIVGDVELVAGANMQLIPIVAVGADPIIRFNAISGEGLIQACVCEGESAPGNPITRISGIAPTTAGDYTIAGSECVDVVPISNGVRIVNKCSQPCCGCPELERITVDLERSLAQQETVKDFVDRLRTSVDSMTFTVLGSRLGDRGCG